MPTTEQNRIARRATERQHTLVASREAVITSGLADPTRSHAGLGRNLTHGWPAPRRGDYNTLGLLTVTAWLLLTGRQDTTNNAMHALWAPDGLTDQEMVYIGLGGIRYTGDRLRQVTHNATAWNTEQDRLDRHRLPLHGRRVDLRRRLTRDDTAPGPHQTHT